MKRLSLKYRLTRYLKSHPVWIAKGYLCDIARSATNATGESVGRRLRELENEGVIGVMIKDGYSWYKIRDVDKEFTDF